jgi:aminoglycoside 6-adenylyltransferase
VVSAFLREAVAWAGEQPDVHGVLLIGSQARADTPADKASDVDLAVFVHDATPFLRDGEWLRRFGQPLLSFREPTAVGGFEERRVLFEDGLEVDFAILPATVATGPPPEVGVVLARGFRVLYDDGIGLDGLKAPTIEPRAPTQAEFDQLTNDFWYHVLWAAKKLWRGEVLVAKQVCDCWLTAELVELARWRSHGHETWHGFRFFERWADEDLVAAMRATFARYDPDDVARALRATADLFGQLEDEVAQTSSLTSSVARREILLRLEALLASSDAVQ